MGTNSVLDSTWTERRGAESKYREKDLTIFSANKVFNPSKRPS